MIGVIAPAYPIPPLQVCLLIARDSIKGVQALACKREGNPIAFGSPSKFRIHTTDWI